MSTVIRVENISKQYRLGEVSTGTLAHDLNRWWHRLRGRPDPYLKIGEINDRSSKGSSEYVWALRDINFEVKHGEVLGIIGKNGAGKSTLLKILSRVTKPTTGRIRAKGRVASLLEVGTGFHPELTGRENIFLNGAILGMTKAEIRRKFDEIVDFSGVERYIDTPVKRYSSGMYVRLAFAVAAHLEPEILVVDEVLAVGDAEFQKKCLGKMKDVSDREGRTVLFVSHNMAAVSNLCNRVVVLNQGATIFNGETKSGINTYLNYLNVNKKRGWSRKEDYNSNAYFDNIDIELSGIQPNIVLKIRFSLFFLKKDQSGFVAFDIKNSQGNTIMQAIPKLLPFINYDINIQHYESLVYLNGLIPDTYFVSFWIGPHNTLTYDFIEDVVSFDIIEGPIAERNFPYTLNHGSVVPASEIKKIK